MDWWQMLLIALAVLMSLFMVVTFAAYMLMSYMASNHLGKVEVFMNIVVLGELRTMTKKLDRVEEELKAWKQAEVEKQA